MTSPLTIEERLERIEAILGLSPIEALPPIPWPLRRAAVLRHAARLFFVSVADIVGSSRIRPLVNARAAVVATLRADPPMSYSEIGRLMHRDHSSIIHLEQIARIEMKKRSAFAKIVDEMRRSVVSEPIGNGS